MHRTTKHGVAQHSTAQHNTAQHSTAQHQATACACQPCRFIHITTLFQLAAGSWPECCAYAVSCVQVCELKGVMYGVGKGMHSRLYTRVLNQFPWMVNCTAISSLYNETGIFSIFASAESASADEMVNVLCKELQVSAHLLLCCCCCHGAHLSSFCRSHS